MSDESMFQAAEFLNSERWRQALNEDNTFLRQQQAIADLLDETKRMTRARDVAQISETTIAALQRLTADTDNPISRKVGEQAIEALRSVGQASREQKK